MNLEDVRIGMRVKTTVENSGMPAGTVVTIEGIVRIQETFRVASYALINILKEPTEKALQDMFEGNICIHYLEPLGHEDVMLEEESKIKSEIGL